MALPFEIQIGRISRFLSKWASTKGSSPRVTLGSEISPVLPMWSGVENRFLDSWAVYQVSYSFAAGGAGNNTVIRVRNPSNSTTIAVFEKIAYTCPVAGQPRWGVYPLATDLANVPGPITGRLDARGAQASSLVVSNQNNAAFGPLTVTNWIAIIGAATGGYIDAIVDDNQEVPLLPGDAITLYESTLNAALSFILRWRERSLEESERQ